MKTDVRRSTEKMVYVFRSRVVETEKCVAKSAYALSGVSIMLTSCADFLIDS